GAEENAAERQNWLQTIHASGRHLLALINDILDLSKIDAGRMEVERVRCSPSALVSEVISILRPRALEKGLLLDVRYDGETPETILTDPTRLRQLLMNVVGNAIKFTEHGRIDLTVGMRREGIRARLRCEVRDTGVGIAPEALKTVFDPFVQADSS